MPAQSKYDVTKTDAWIAAIERGKQYLVACIGDPDNLDVISASKIAGVSEAALRQQIEDGRLYAFPLAGETSEVLIPSWQLCANAERLRIALNCFSKSECSPFIVHSFFERTYDDFGGLSGRDAVLSDDLEIGFIRQIIERSLPGEQGAL